MKKKDWTDGLRLFTWLYTILSSAFLLHLLYDLMVSKGGSAIDITFDSFMMIDILLLCIMHRKRFQLTRWSIYQALSIILIIIGVTTLLVGVNSERPEVYFTFSPIVIIDILLLCIVTLVRKIRKDGLFSIFSLLRSTRFQLTLCYIALITLILFIFSSSIYSSENVALKTSLNNYMTQRFTQISTTYSTQTHRLSLTGAEGQLGNTSDDVILLLNPHGAVLQSFDSTIRRELDTAFIIQQAVQRSQGFMNDPIWQQEAIPLITLPQGSTHVYYLGNSYTYNLPDASYEFSQAIISNSQGKVIALLVLGTPSNVNGMLHNLQVIIEITIPLVLLLSIYGGYWLAARAMHSVQAITHTVKQISETDLHRRLNVKKRDELGELAATFDHMLDRLEAAFERQRQFTADASHELRTPLTIVDLETTRALTHNLSSAEYCRALIIVQQENRHMAHLVNDLLMLARTDSGQSKLKQEEVDLSEVIVDTVERLAPLAQQTCITISMSPLPEITILGDYTYLAQLFTNIIENALKYSAGNGTDVEIDLARTYKQNQEWAEIHIRDDGPGIAPEHLSHLFERFYRVDKSRTHSKQLETEDTPTQPAGNGLGLSIAQWIAQEHGGHIQVQSTLGQGSDFEICLPLIP